MQVLKIKKDQFIRSLKYYYKYTKQGKTGFHLLDNKYKGFDESSIFITNSKALKWDWLLYYRIVELMPEQLVKDMNDL